MEPGYLIMAALAGWMVYAYADLVLEATGQTRAQRLAKRRARRAELAAIEASDDEPAFDPGHVRAEIELMLGLVERAWATGEDTLSGRHDHRELARWRIDRWLGTRTFDQRWTLGRRNDRWELLRFVHEPTSGRTLRRRLVPMPWTDRERLQGESLRELAAAERPAIGVSDRYRDAGVRARDLALVDARYSAPVIESVLLRLIEAWEQAALGRPQQLRRLATQRAGDSLRRKVAVDGLDLLEWRVMLLDDRREPVRMTVEVDLSGGNEVRWTLESCEGSDPLWRLAAAS